jgi:hypothetical protein
LHSRSYWHACHEMTGRRLRNDRPQNRISSSVSGAANGDEMIWDKTTWIDIIGILVALAFVTVWFIEFVVHLKRDN